MLRTTRALLLTQPIVILGAVRGPILGMRLLPRTRIRVVTLAVRPVPRALSRKPSLAYLIHGNRRDVHFGPPVKVGNRVRAYAITLSASACFIAPRSTASARYAGSESRRGCITAAGE